MMSGRGHDCHRINIKPRAGEVELVDLFHLPQFYSHTVDVPFQ